jgi:NAD(P)-dependent dehydrogenase (short-subunit alcohol dehydrogenase family)
MQMRMNGRNALITGGSLGIGRAIAKNFANAGANVAIVARNQGPLDEAKADIAAQANVKVVTVAADVGTADGCRKAYESAASALGHIDVLVNNAGTSQRGPFLEITDELWQHDLDLKLFAAIRLCRQAFPGMKSHRWGRIINVLNIGAKAPQATSAPTSVSRAAGMALTKVLAGEGAPHNVLVNALLVGNIESNQWVKRHAAENKGRALGDFYTEMGKRIPMGRVGTSEEFANMALFLASDAGSYITGTAINIDGGMSPVV